jgi:hypothetical protein
LCHADEGRSHFWPVGQNNRNPIFRPNACRAQNGPHGSGQSIKLPIGHPIPPRRANGIGGFGVALD